MDKHKLRARLRELHQQAYRDNIYHHPLLAGAYGVSVIVFASTSLRNGGILSLLLLLLMLPVCVLSNLFYRRLHKQFRMLVIFLTSAVVYVGISKLLPFWFGELPVVYRYCIPMIVVSPMLVSYAGKFAVQCTLAETLMNVLYACLAFAVAACTVGMVREFFAYGTIGGKIVVQWPTNNTMATAPFFGFIVLGFFMAVLKAVRNMHDSRHNPRKKKTLDHLSDGHT